MFEQNQLVVCIDEDWSCQPGMPPHPHGVPRKGGIYTIDEVEYCDGLACLLLAEFPLHAVENGDLSHPMWAADSFRPLSHDRIAVFTALLNPSPVPGVTPEPADA